MRPTLTHLLATALASTAVAAPAAIAQPTDLRSPDARDAAVRTSSLAGTAEPRPDVRNFDKRAETAAIAQERYYGSYATGDGPSQELRSPDARDAAQGRGTFNTPDVAVVKLSQPAPVVDDGIDWGDVGIGAGAALGLSLLALGGTFAVVHRRRDTRPMATIS